MYGEKFYHSYCNPFGITCRISIQKIYYVGSATEVEAQETPILIVYESESDFKFDGARPSSAEIFLTFGTGNGVDFEEFWTADERDFKIVHTIGADIDWVGYVIPNGFGYQLKGGVYYASLEASDGLSTLDGYDFKDDNTNSPYGTQDLTFNNGFEFPWILTISEILKKLGLELPIWTCIDVYERSMNKIADSREGDPLATSYSNVKTYIEDTEKEDIPYWRDEGQVWTCLKVLENICHIFSAKIYQSEGAWRIKRVNVDADYGSGPTQRYWRKYNSEAVYIGREIVNRDVTVFCDQEDNAMIGTDHEMRMDEVYAAFRINYKYTFLREGDNPISLLSNGDFQKFNNVSKLSAPDNWERFKLGDYLYLRLRDEVISNPEDVGGNTKGVSFGQQAPGQSNDGTNEQAFKWTGLRYAEPIQVDKNDSLFFNFWTKHRPRYGLNNVSPIFKFILTAKDEQGKEVVYHLGNAAETNEYDPNDGDAPFAKTQWVNREMFLMASPMYTDAELTRLAIYDWKQTRFKVADTPVSGNITIQIHGLGTTGSDETKKRPAFQVINANGNEGRRRIIYADSYSFNGGGIEPLIVTGVELGLIPEESNLPQGQDFIYRNRSGRYTLEPDPIEVYNGDIQDASHISNIIVPTNTTGQKNFWDTIDNQYGNSSLGLIAVKSIMNQYFEPKRIIEGVIKQADLTFDTRFEFSFLPNIKFILQRGSFNRKLAYLEDAMFVQISQNTLPFGGTEGGNNTSPAYVQTGASRCQRDGSGLNTGGVEYEYVNVNSNSDTFNETQWLIGASDLTMCPIGEPQRYYWGSEVLSYDYNNFETDGYREFNQDGIDKVTMEFSNDGTGKYLFFLHLDSLGLVSGIETQTQDEIISDWNYLTDTVIGGFTYKVLRMNYITAEYDNFGIIFKFA